MQKLVAVVAVLVTFTFALICLPLIAVAGFVGGDGNSFDLAAPYACGQHAVILDTIRSIESDTHYDIAPNRGGASGAYQYINITWQYWARRVDIDTVAYPVAYLAPPADQDRAADANITSILADHHDDVTAIPVAWYLPAALDDPALMDVVPMPAAGNTLTPRQYQRRWMGRYTTTFVEHDGLTTAFDCITTLSTDRNWALPAPRGLLTVAGLSAPHHDDPAADLMLGEHTPIYAIAAGTVTRETHFDANWYTAGCTSRNPPAGCATCGNGITIQSDSGIRFTYCHNSHLTAAVGDHIAVGQHIADSGNTGRSGAPHVHVELHVNNIRRCPQQLLVAIYNDEPIPDPATLPTTGCTFTTNTP